MFAIMLRNKCGIIILLTFVRLGRLQETGIFIATEKKQWFRSILYFCR